MQNKLNNKQNCFEQGHFCNGFSPITSAGLVKNKASKATAMLVALALMCMLLPGAAYAEMLPVESGKIAAEIKVEDAKADVELRASQTAISLTVPIFVTLGGSAGYDIANPKPCIEEPITFRNAGNNAVQIIHILTDEYEAGSFQNVIKRASPEISGNNTPIEDQTPYSLYPKSQPEKALNMAYKNGRYTGGAKIEDEELANQSALRNAFGDTFIIGSDSALECTFRLNLTNSYDVPTANAVVDPTAAAGENSGKVHPLSKITYIVGSYIPAGEGNANLDWDSGNVFFLNDEQTGIYYSAFDVKGHAQDISKNGKNSLYYGMYSGYVYGYRPYTCSLLMNSSGEIRPYNLNIIGILHDNLADGTGKAGLTFQMADIFKMEQMNTSKETVGGWAATSLRADMNEETGSIYQSFHRYITDLAATVNKEYSPVSNTEGANVTGNESNTRISQDKYFIASYSELFSTAINPIDQIYRVDGYRYEYYKNIGISIKTPATSFPQNEQYKKTYQGEAKPWWTRSLHNGKAGMGVMYINQNDYCFPAALQADTQNGVVPCFCF
ncbi:DUF6273 domain-containing protein [Adlercreutzia sp. ZJ154]|uniref:DUF6273 domain-containing protein n=1 Tax=Adlercreutzia sp. ZJ154 TaxID=2709790 RepID=UPI0013EDA705|nr:DUF6273 domain-containing protein [Adlercreutzia sp. ZJ154]